MWFIVQHTKIGTAMRAVSFNMQAASLMGVNVNRIVSFTFGLGSALAAVAGILYAMRAPGIDPLMGVQPGLRAFIAAVLGGIGNLPGAALGGIVLGLVETFAGGIPGVSNYRDGIAFAMLIAILIFRPAGLLGKAANGKSMTMHSGAKRSLVLAIGMAIVLTPLLDWVVRNAFGTLFQRLLPRHHHRCRHQYHPRGQPEFDQRPHRPVQPRTCGLYGGRAATLRRN